MELHTWDQRGRNRVVKVEQKSEQALGREIAVPGNRSGQGPGEPPGGAAPAGRGGPGRAEASPGSHAFWDPGARASSVTRSKRPNAQMNPSQGSLTGTELMVSSGFLGNPGRRWIEAAGGEGHWEHLANGDTGLAENSGVA